MGDEKTHIPDLSDRPGRERLTVRVTYREAGIDADPEAEHYVSWDGERLVLGVLWDGGAGVEVAFRHPETMISAVRQVLDVHGGAGMMEYHRDGHPRKGT